jgi:hypothetical protein
VPAASPQTSVSRLSAFVPITMKGFENGLSLKFFLSKGFRRIKNICRLLPGIGDRKALEVTHPKGKTKDFLGGIMLFTKI